jgi:opine dehydrogenase
MEIAVLGGGHGCYAAAAHLSEQGHAVRFWRRSAVAFEDVLATRLIHVKDFRGEREVEVQTATLDLREAVSGAHLIVIPLPATAHDALSQQLAPLLTDGQVVFLPPGTFGSFIFAKAQYESGNAADVSYAETGTLPYLARKHDSNKVVISGYATRLPTGVWPAKNTDHALEVLSKAYPIERCEDALSGALMNAGPIIHPPLILMNAGPLEHFEAWDIHNEGTQPSIRRVTDALDAERIALREALGYGAPHFPLRDHYNKAGQGDEWMYGRAAHERLTDSGDWRELIDLQQHRYMIEDTCLGLSFLVSVGRWLGVATPVAEGLLNIAIPVAERDLYETGRSLESLGLSDLSRDDMTQFLAEGFGTNADVSPIASIGVIGAGRMGRGIAISYAFAGVPVCMVDLKQRSVAERDALYQSARNEIGADLAFLANVGLCHADDLEGIVARISFTDSEQTGASLSACSIVYEAVPEVIEAKKEALAFASRHLSDTAVLASTTSTILVSELAGFVAEPSRFLNAHWLNPAHLMPLVELSVHESVASLALSALEESLQSIGKVTVVCSASPGYIVPRIQALAMNEAARLVEEGVATAQEIDTAINVGFGPRFAVLGLLEFIDWGGGDILFYASKYLAREVDERYTPPEIVETNMRDGRNGVREGMGFFDYRDRDVPAYRNDRLREFVELLRHRGLLPKHGNALIEGKRSR